MREGKLNTDAISLDECGRVELGDETLRTLEKSAVIATAGGDGDDGNVLCDCFTVDVVCTPNCDLDLNIVCGCNGWFCS